MTESRGENDDSSRLWHQARALSGFYDGRSGCPLLAWRTWATGDTASFHRSFTTCSTTQSARGGPCQAAAKPPCHLTAEFPPSERKAGIVPVGEIGTLPTKNLAVLLRVQQHYPLWIDCNVDFLAHSNWLHSGATSDEMLIAPANVHLGEIALKDSFSHSR